MRNKDLNYDFARQLIEQWQQVAPCLFGDFHPLTDYSLTNDAWIAWQFDRPEQGDGMIQAFRRDKCEESSKSFLLCGLDPGVPYTITNLDTNISSQASGKDLMEKGLTVELKEKPGAALIAYKAMK